MQKPIIHCDWIAAKELLSCRLQGRLCHADIRHWQDVLQEALEKIPHNKQFIFYLDERGYDYQTSEVHRVKKAVLPKILARYHFYLQLVGESENQKLSQQVEPNKRGVRCRAVAMIHHNVDIMQQLQSQFGSAQEAYFSDIDLAESWLQAIMP